MAQVRLSSNVGSITLATSGVLTPTNNIITCTAAEATTLGQAAMRPENFLVSTLANGNTSIWLPSIITSITINSVVYTPTSNIISGVPAADATIFLGVDFQSPFQLVIG